MNINAKIDWQPGMDITAQTFIELDENIDFRQQIAARITHDSRMGILPGTTFDCQGVFVKNTFEINRFQCMALLSSGRILHADERVVVTIPMLYGDEYYLAVGFSEKQTSFEKEDVAFVQPVYEYSIHTLAELKDKDLFPIMRFKMTEGIFSIDTTYIPPCLFLSSDDRLAAVIDQYIQRLSALAEHANLEDGEGKRCLLRYLFLLKGYNRDESVSAFLKLTQEMAQAICYYIVIPNTNNPQPIPACQEADIQHWLHWLDEYMTGVVTILDAVVLEDHSIDFDELKAQIKSELYEQIRPELYKLLLTQIKKELHADLSRTLKETLTEYINMTFKKELHDLLQVELSETLSEKLYQTLYDALFNALYVPVEEDKEEEYTPLI